MVTVFSPFSFSWIAPRLLCGPSLFASWVSYSTRCRRACGSVVPIPGRCIGRSLLVSLGHPMPAKTKSPKRISYSDKVFLPYVAALGQLALAWNGFHETLALLFCSVAREQKPTKEDPRSGQLLAIWHALKSDRSQREILLAAVKNHLWPAYPTKFEDDVKWICNRADSLEDARNDALHSPLWAFERGSRETIVMPIVGLGHVRATKLFDKNLLSEFRRCRDTTLILTRFAGEIDEALSNWHLPWPDRPKLPNRGDGRGAKYPPRPKPRTPPRSSQA
jgi:hypothetical protein